MDIRNTGDKLTGVFVGCAATVLPQLQALIDATGADELLSIPSNHASTVAESHRRV
ncbi:hypothetical protein [Nocardia sp. NPDC004750]